MPTNDTAHDAARPMNQHEARKYRLLQDVDQRNIEQVWLRHAKGDMSLSEWAGWIRVNLSQAMQDDDDESLAMAFLLTERLENVLRKLEGQEPRKSWVEIIRDVPDPSNYRHKPEE